MAKYNRPYILYNAAMSIDGKTASRSGDSTLSDDQDWHEVHDIRNRVDGIMVGINTILQDDAKLTVKFHDPPDKYPHRIVVDSKGRIPLNAKVIHHQRSRYPTILATTSQADDSKLIKLRELGVKTLICGDGPHVNLKILMSKLHKREIQSILLEGGGSLAWGMIEADMVDELRVFIAPFVVGGKLTTGLAMGKGFEEIQSSRKFSLSACTQRGDYVILHYIRNSETD